MRKLFAAHLRIFVSPFAHRSTQKGLKRIRQPMRMEEVSPCGWKGCLHADGPWGPAQRREAREVEVRDLGREFRVEAPEGHGLSVARLRPAARECVFLSVQFSIQKKLSALSPPPRANVSA